MWAIKALRFAVMVFLIAPLIVAVGSS
ncbi:MAG: hypothetical protein RL322_2854, partial [Pseudomonadota bacterium]